MRSLVRSCCAGTFTGTALVSIPVLPRGARTDPLPVLPSGCGFGFGFVGTCGCGPCTFGVMDGAPWFLATCTFGCSGDFVTLPARNAPTVITAIPPAIAHCRGCATHLHHAA